MEMAKVRLEPITRDNWREAIKLPLEPEQERYIASNLVSIAQSKVEPWWQTYAIHAGAEMVGFAMFGFVPEEGCYWICRLMIAREHQRRGYGRAAMVEILRRLHEAPDCREVRISFVPENEVARQLYLGLGFEECGVDEDGEIILSMRVWPHGASAH